MITDALLDILNAFFTTLRSWLPVWNWQLTNNIVASIKFELSRWDAILPIHELFQIVTLSFAIWAAMLGYRVAKWIFEQIVAVIP